MYPLLFLRECVEKLQLLNAPEEHTRRLNEVPDVHTDPKMDPSYESPEDERGQDEIAQDPDFASQEKNIEPMMTSIENPSPNVEAKSSAVEPKAQNEQQSEISPAKDATGFVVDENEKIWHYKDPSGKIQGPFTMAQLRKWSKHFPNNLRTWRKSEQQEDSILLTDALAGNSKRTYLSGFLDLPTQLNSQSQ
ncbi:hypothetical protein HPP92_002466 [Vanilla planifolia]|uniref:GYF domain-containing protein n=1 Tax=Vanilla planifolia TaxID=51239 RepID=A0A835S002_VANPL|nr:hypothetical protein HPP92_002466 [Vanilla planifolia]